jgi:uncharacterized protein (DUF1330 family)
MEEKMPGKGFWIFQMDVSDPDGYAAYQKTVSGVLRKYGARFLVRGGRMDIVEGSSPSRVVVIEFNDYETALACWNSPEYKSSKSFRQGNAAGNVILVEGYDGPQPSDH